MYHAFFYLCTIRRNTASMYQTGWNYRGDLIFVSKFHRQGQEKGKIKGTGTNLWNVYRFLPLTQTKIRYFVYSHSEEFTDSTTTEIPEESIFSLKIQDSVACIYDKNWWIEIIEETSEETNNFFIHFFIHMAPELLSKSLNMTVWMPISQVLRKILSK